MPVVGRARSTVPRLGSGSIGDRLIGLGAIGIGAIGVGSIGRPTTGGGWIGGQWISDRWIGDRWIGGRRIGGGWIGGGWIGGGWIGRPTTGGRRISRRTTGDRTITRRPSRDRTVAVGSIPVGSIAVGSVAVGSVAVGSVAVGSVAVGSIAVGSVGDPPFGDRLIGGRTIGRPATRNRWNSRRAIGGRTVTRRAVGDRLHRGRASGRPTIGDRLIGGRGIGRRAGGHRSWRDMRRGGVRPFDGSATGRDAFGLPRDLETDRGLAASDDAADPQRCRVAERDTVHRRAVGAPEIGRDDVTVGSELEQEVAPRHLWIGHQDPVALASELERAPQRHVQRGAVDLGDLEDRVIRARHHGPQRMRCAPRQDPHGTMHTERCTRNERPGTNPRRVRGTPRGIGDALGAIDRAMADSARCSWR